MNKSIFRLSCLIIFVLIFSNCGKVYRGTYYILDYTTSIQDSIKNYTTLPYRVQVSEFDIPLTYDRSGIVIRNSLHKMRYSVYDLWALRPQNALQNLLTKHLSDAKIFNEAKKEYLDVRPDFIILGNIYFIELYRSIDINRADIGMKLSLKDNQTDEILVTHKFSRLEELDNDNRAFFAKRISDVLEEEYNRFILKIIKHFSNKSTYDIKGENNEEKK